MNTFFLSDFPTILYKRKWCRLEPLCTLITQISPTFFYEKDNIHNIKLPERLQASTHDNEHSTTRDATQTDTARHYVRHHHEKGYSNWYSQMLCQKKGIAKKQGSGKHHLNNFHGKMFKYPKTVWSLLSHDMGRLHHRLPVCGCSHRSKGLRLHTETCLTKISLHVTAQVRHVRQVKVPKHFPKVSILLSRKISRMQKPSDLGLWLLVKWSFSDLPNLTSHSHCVSTCGLSLVYSISGCPLLATLPGINKVLTLITCTHHFIAAAASAVYLTLPLSSWHHTDHFYSTGPSHRHLQELETGLRGLLANTGKCRFPCCVTIGHWSTVFLQNTTKILKTLRRYYILGIGGAVNGPIT